MPNKIYINARFLTQSVTGVQQYALEIVRNFDLLLDRGEIDPNEYTFTLLTPSKGVIHDPGLKHISLRQVGRLTGHAWEQAELPFYSGDGLLFCPGNTAPVISLASGQKTAVTVHSLAYLYFPESYSLPFKAFYNIIVPFVLKKADAAITVSQAEKDLILKSYPFAAKRLHVVQNGGLSGSCKVEDKDIGLKSTRMTNPFLLFVGSLSRGKNLRAVVKALSLLEQENLDLVVVGATGKTFAEAGMDIPDHLLGRIHFRGQIDNWQELLHLYKIASCLVFPSYYESSGLPPVEAMACLCPVIVSDIPALRERCGDAALYCSPDNPRELAERIKQVLTNNELKESLKEKGLQRSRMFTWEKTARETWTIIKNI